MNRLIAQDSEHSILSWIKTVALDDILGLDTREYCDDRFYRISDKLLKNQDWIEENLYQREKNLFNLENSIFLYDLPNTYFEGICANNPKADYNGNQDVSSACYCNMLNLMYLFLYPFTAESAENAETAKQLAYD